LPPAWSKWRCEFTRYCVADVDAGRGEPAGDVLTHGEIGREDRGGAPGASRVVLQLAMETAVEEHAPAWVLDHEDRNGYAHAPFPPSMKSARGRAAIRK
jgi:hypothetical protein